jgi:hypothetical protein
MVTWVAMYKVGVVWRHRVDTTLKTYKVRCKSYGIGKSNGLHI